LYNLKSTYFANNKIGIDGFEVALSKHQSPPTCLLGHHKICSPALKSLLLLMLLEISIQEISSVCFKFV